MFTTGTRSYFEALPDLPGTDPDEIRRILTSAYIDVVSSRLELERTTGPEVSEVTRFLRRLGSALSIYSQSEAASHQEIRHAAAFVAAEAFFLLAEHRGEDVSNVADLYIPTRMFEAAEASLLYLIAGHDSNAAISAGRLLSGRFGFPSGPTASSAVRLFSNIQSLCRLRPTAQRESEETLSEEPGAATDVAQVAAMDRLSNLIDRYVRWLTSADPGNDDQTTLAEIQALLDVFEQAAYGSHSMLMRITQLVLDAVRETGSRALRNAPRPTVDEGDAYGRYIETRTRDRPVLWPPAHQYAASCLPGPNKHAVVSVPTGSGKGLLAELAAVHAALDGWVVYLVPTNALANQVRRDLEIATAPAEFISVQAYLGGQEYTTLTTEAVTEVPTGTVVVMTPEKCSLALRRSPQAFATLRLIVLDECHLIGEPGPRGVIAELVMAHLLSIAPDAKALMMSALVENPEHLATWLTGVTGIESVPLGLPWRPTRTLRGIVGVRRRVSDERAQEAAESLRTLPDRRVNMRFSAPLRIAANLQGAWGSDDDRDYVLIDVDLEADLVVSRTRSRTGEWDYGAAVAGGYTNTTVARLATYMATHGERVLCFVPRSRHDPFVLARTISAQEFESVPSADSNQQAILNAHLSCAEFELGLESEVRTRLDEGICVHSSALLDAERHAVEFAFQEGIVPIMAATGTLAQGLNLPATAVLIAGTQMGAESRTSAQARDRVRQQLLNAIGRAGRAAVANHGVALVVPNDLVRFESPEDSHAAAAGAEFLRFEDASTPIKSRTRALIEAALGGRLISNALTVEEMTAYTYLPTSTADQAADAILFRSLGAWEALGTQRGNRLPAVRQALQRLGSDFLRIADAPEWVGEVAHRSGLPLPILFSLFRSVSQRGAHGIEEGNDLMAAAAYVLDAIAGMEPELASQALWSSEYLGPPTPIRGLTFSALGSWPLPNRETLETVWSALRSTTLMFLSGAPLNELAGPALGTDTAASDSQRNAGGKPLPKLIAATRHLQERLSILAGGVAAIYDVGAETGDERWVLDPLTSERLQMAPLALRSGCGSTSSLSWFRFGLKYRRPAHLLARAFPVPSDLENDEARGRWVRDARRRWLSGELLSSAPLNETERRLLLDIQLLFRTRRS